MTWVLLDGPYLELITSRTYPLPYPLAVLSLFLALPIVTISLEPFFGSTCIVKDFTSSHVFLLAKEKNHEWRTLSFYVIILLNRNSVFSQKYAFRFIEKELQKQKKKQRKENIIRRTSSSSVFFSVLSLISSKQIFQRRRDYHKWDQLTRR